MNIATNFVFRGVNVKVMGPTYNVTVAKFKRAGDTCNVKHTTDKLSSMGISASGCDVSPAR